MKIHPKIAELLHVGGWTYRKLIGPVTTVWSVLRLRLEKRPPIWGVIKNVLNKQLREADKEWSSSMGFGEVLIMRHRKNYCITKRSQLSRNWTQCLGQTNQWKRDMSCSTWNVRSMYRSRSLTAVARELTRYKLDLVGVEEVRWKKVGTLSQ
jgi:hypothetical protein